ncbi:CD225/dispanin family protein [Luteimonas sp. e5]
MSTPYPVQTPVQNYMVWSIINTVLSAVLCCFTCLSFIGIITGIVAIVKSSKVNPALQRGDAAAAQQASAQAKTWNWVTSGILIASVLLWIVFLATGMSDNYQQQMMEILEQMQQQS